LFLQNILAIDYRGAESWSHQSLEKSMVLFLEGAGLANEIMTRSADVSLWSIQDPRNSRNLAFQCFRKIWCISTHVSNEDSRCTAGPFCFDYFSGGRQ